MPLYDAITKKQVHPKKAEQYVALVKLRRELPSNTFGRLVRTVDEAIHSCRPSQSSSLVWTRMAALFGNNSAQPHRHLDHLWEKVEGILGPGKLSLKAIGGLLRWRISLRDDTWLVYYRDSNEIDPQTGKLIAVSEYWIDNTFVPPGNTPPSGSQLEDLASAWGARLA